MKILALVGVLLLTACLQGTDVASIEQPLDPIVTSGSRLQGRTHTTTYSMGDGFSYKQRSDIFFYDSTLRHDCIIVPDGSGVMRCMPIADASYDGYNLGPESSMKQFQNLLIRNYSTPLFKTVFVPTDCDPGSRVFAVYDPSGTANPLYLYGYKIDGTSWGTPLSKIPYTMGGEVKSSGYDYYDAAGAGCQYVRTPTPGFRFFEIGPAAPLSLFAQFSKVDATESLP